MSSSGIVLSNGARLWVRGRCGFTSTTNRRSGSRPAASSSSRVPPKCSDRLTAPPSGGAAWAVITRGLNRAKVVANWRKPFGTSCTSWPSANKMRSAGPKKPHRYDTPNFANTS
jgi:hypothetical protein